MMICLVAMSLACNAPARQSASPVVAAASPTTVAMHESNDSSHQDDHGLSKLGPCLDGGSDDPNFSQPPTTIGTISKIDGSTIYVEPENRTMGTTRISVFLLSKQTSLCTVYGGLVSRDQLLVGQKVGVWSALHGGDTSGEPTVATAVMLASKQPGDNWP